MLSWGDVFCVESVSFPQAVRKRRRERVNAVSVRGYRGSPERRFFMVCGV